MKYILKNQFPDCTIDPNVGIVDVPDARQLTRLRRTEQTVQSTMPVQFLVLVLSWV